MCTSSTPEVFVIFVCVITQLAVMVISGQGKTQLIRLQVRMINNNSA